MPFSHDAAQATRAARALLPVANRSFRLKLSSPSTVEDTLATSLRMTDSSLTSAASRPKTNNWNIRGITRDDPSIALKFCNPSRVDQFLENGFGFFPRQPQGRA